MKKHFLLFVFLIPFLISMTPHPIYVSTTEIDYKPTEKSIEIAIKIFSDDLEDVLSASNGINIEIGTDREHPKAKEYIMNYLRKHFQLEVNDKTIEYEYVAKRMIKKDFFAMWIFLKATKVRKAKSIKLTNNILIDFHPKQQNIISYRGSAGPYQKFTTYKGQTKIQLK